MRFTALLITLLLTVTVAYCDEPLPIVVPVENGDTLEVFTAEHQGDTVVVKRNRVQRLRDKIHDRIERKLHEPYDTTRNKGYWWRALKHGKVNFDDESMGYPKFLKFCWHVYKWGDKAFNSYDTAYVVSTGKPWKLTLKNQNWIDNFNGSNDLGRTRFTSGAASNLGLYLSFMAVSLGYSLDIDRLVGERGTSELLEFSFTCARFSAEIFKRTNTGRMSTHIKLAGESSWQSGDKLYALQRRTWGLTAYYYFNNRKYARAAAYCYSKYQLRSAGSAIAGLTIIKHKFTIDPNELTERQAEVIERANLSAMIFTDYCLSGGYAHNWVLSKTLLLNATGAVGAGVKHIYRTETSPSSNSGALNVRARLALTFNRSRYFASLQGLLNSSTFFGGSYRFSYLTADFNAVFGIRF